MNVNDSEEHSGEVNDEINESRYGIVNDEANINDRKEYRDENEILDSIPIGCQATIVMKSHCQRKGKHTCTPIALRRPRKRRKSFVILFAVTLYLNYTYHLLSCHLYNVFNTPPK